MIHLLVSIKQVPDTTNIRIDPETGSMIRKGVPAILNPYDAHAVASAAEWKKKLGGKLTVITMGPPAAKEALQECIEMGADRAVLISDRAFAGSDTLATSYVLAEAIRKIDQEDHVDLVFFGKQAIDGDTAQVGPELAAFLDIPYVAWARQLTFVEPEVLQVERLLDHGYDGVEVRLPALITVVKEINEPRVPSFKAKLWAKKQKIPVLGLQDLGLHPHQVGLPGSFTQVVKVFPPPARGQRELSEGSPTELANRLWTRLYEMKLG